MDVLPEEGGRVGVRLAESGVAEAERYGYMRYWKSELSNWGALGCEMKRYFTLVVKIANGDVFAVSLTALRF